MEDRWTKEQLESVDDRTFIICILNERRNGLNYYSPLSLRLKTVINKFEHGEL